MQVILSIAGSDPSGGAGIQADLKTITSIGHYGAAVITAITCQNSLGVSQISPVEPSLVRDQIRSVLDDASVSHIKIGMTGTPAIITTIEACLASFAGEVILDPVLKSSSGSALLTDAPLALSPLISRATVLTPNTHELSQLSGLNCATRAEAIQAGRHLLKSYHNLKAICLKGGHLKESSDVVEDILLFRHENMIQEQSICHPRLQTRNSHGTGCTFASAFCSFHAHCLDYKTAFRKTVQYMSQLLAQGTLDELGAGTGPLVHYRFNHRGD